MPRKVSQFERTEQPINWGKSIVCGMLGATFMMAFIDTFYMMGITPFSFEYFLGTLLRGGVEYGPQNWVLGFLANLVTGGIFGIVYAYCFEYVYFRASGRIGMALGMWHSLLAAVAVFPFFTSIHEFMGTGVYQNFGILGYKLGLQTPILLVTGHLLFGATMGVFYGSVRAQRIRAKRGFEPGELARPGDPDLITLEDDPPDRVAV
jgi:hypothetical protein